MIETALDEEMADHRGYDKHDPGGRGSGNSRNGTRTKTVLTDNVGPVQIAVPRDRDSTFNPIIVKKRQRRLGGVDTIVLSLVAKGLTTGEVSAHFEEIYGASLSKDTISRITDRVLTEMAEWMARPLEKGQCSSTRSTSRSVTGRLPTGRSMPRSGRSGQPQGRPRAVGRDRRRRERQVLAARADRTEEPRRPRCVLHCLRRPRVFTSTKRPASAIRRGRWQMRS